MLVWADAASTAWWWWWWWCCSSQAAELFLTSLTLSDSVSLYFTWHMCWRTCQLSVDTFPSVSFFSFSSLSIFFVLFLWFCICEYFMQIYVNFSRYVCSSCCCSRFFWTAANAVSQGRQAAVTTCTHWISVRQCWKVCCKMLLNFRHQCCVLTAQHTAKQHNKTTCFYPTHSTQHTARAGGGEETLKQAFACPQLSFEPVSCRVWTYIVTL